MVPTYARMITAHMTIVPTTANTVWTVPNIQPRRSVQRRQRASRWLISSLPGLFGCWHAHTLETHPLRSSSTRRAERRAPT